MSEETTLAAVVALVQTLTSPTPKRVINGARETVEVADFPAVVVEVSGQDDETWTVDATGGLMTHTYTIAVLVLVGTLQTPLKELYTRVQPWAPALAALFRDNPNLSGTVAVTGNVGASQFSGRRGTIQLSNTNVCYGFIGKLPVSEFV